MDIQQAWLKAREIEQRFFSSASDFIVMEDAEAIPLVAANVVRSTASFNAGQRVLIHDGYWGVAERLKVVGRYRMKHRLVRGVCAIRNLQSYRPKIVHDPAVIRLLVGTQLHLQSFRGFLDLEHQDRYMFVVDR